MTSEELRRKFISFFVNKGHKELPPASLVPSEIDPSVLFTTAGMQQFKRFYTNPDEAPAKNVVTCQPCFRTSDIEEVGDDTHVTLLEMLGNFSFGGYFKKETVEWAYEFLTKELGIESNRITSTIFRGDEITPRDNESADILEGMELAYKEHDREDNFWGPTGEEGPCGPTVEFYIDGIEVWNLVFNEYFKDKNGKYTPLKVRGVDTGMGLERILGVKNDFDNVYESDLFQPVIQEIEKVSAKKYVENVKAFRIIADHAKAAVFLTSAKIIPSNVGQGYILRRLIRRVVRYGWLLNLKTLIPLIPVITAIYETIYPELKNQRTITDVIRAEEEKFQKTIDAGLKKAEAIFSQKKPLSEENYSKIMQISDRSDVLKKIYHDEVSNNVDSVLEANNIKVLNSEIKAAYISGKEAFDLYQSYGFPLELILELAQKERLFVGITDFREEVKKHQDLSRTASAGMFKSGLAGESNITTRMHTATHLLLKALQVVLGQDVHQRGSNITEERIRFDFSYPKPMTAEEIKKVEDIVNEKIKEDLPVEKKETTVDEAKKMGAEAQFIEKYVTYGKLTMYSIGDFSHELCGGPHVARTGEIGKFKITKEESSSSGVRRIRAILE